MEELEESNLHLNTRMSGNGSDGGRCTLDVLLEIMNFYRQDRDAVWVEMVLFLFFFFF